MVRVIGGPKPKNTTQKPKKAPSAVYLAAAELGQHVVDLCLGRVEPEGPEYLHRGRGHAVGAGVGYGQPKD